MDRQIHDQQQDMNQGGGGGAPQEIPICRFFNSPRGCRAAQDCRYRHVQGPPGVMPPMRPPMHMVICRDWTSPAGCRYGNRCKFSHEGQGRHAPGAEAGPFGQAAHFNPGPYGSHMGGPPGFGGGGARPPRPVCRDWISEEGCRFRSCRFAHSGPGKMSEDQAPRLPCRDFSSPQGCKYGDACRFDHQNPQQQMQGGDANMGGGQ